jgi:hypothetical protein
LRRIWVAEVVVVEVTEGVVGGGMMTTLLPGMTGMMTAGRGVCDSLYSIDSYSGALRDIYV